MMMFYNVIMDKANLFDAIPASLPDEVTAVLCSGADVRIERTVSRGHASPDGFWYDQEEHEWVLLVAGSAALEIEGQGEVELAPGDYLLLPAHCRHRVTRTASATDTIWLALFFR